MASSDVNLSESSSDDEQLDKNLEFFKIIKYNKLKSVDEKKKNVDDALAKGININIQDFYNSKRTALYYAVKNGDKELVLHLLDKGANVMTEDKEANPLKYAKKIKQRALSGSAEEQTFTKIIDALKNKISFQDPQPSTSQSKTYKTTAAVKEGSKDSKQKLTVSQRDEVVSSANITKSETFEASGLKIRPLHGTIYQLKLLMLFAKRCHDQGYEFRLATEMVGDSKFDDVVVEFHNQNDKTKCTLFLQAKHSQKDDNKRIRSTDLMSKSDGDFSLQKYLRFYQKIVKNSKVNEQRKIQFIIYTNIHFEFDDDSKPVKMLTPFYFEPFDGKIDLLNLESSDVVNKNKFYKLIGSIHEDKRNKVVSELKSLFEETTDFYKLAKELAEHLIYEKEITLETPLFQTFRINLIKEVIDMKDNKFHKKFISLNSNISSEAQYFRAVFLKSIEKTLNTKPNKAALDKELLKLFKKGIDFPENKTKLSNDAFQEFWNEVGKIELKISDGFKQNLLLEYIFENPFVCEKVIQTEIEGFLNDLVFAVNQPSLEKLSKIFIKEIEKEFNIIDSQLVTDDFEKFILDWFNKKAGTYLKNQDIDSFFDKTRQNISQIIFIDHTSEHIKELIKTKIVFKPNALPTQLLDFLNQSNDKSQIKHKVCHFDTANTSPLLGSVKVIQALKEQSKSYNRDDSFISLNLDSLISKPDRELKALNESKELIIVKCDSFEKKNKNVTGICKKIIFFLNNSDKNRLLLIGTIDNVFIDYFCYNYFESQLKIDDESYFNDLTISSQKDLLNRKCKFQGYDVEFNHLFNKNQTNITNSIVLADLLDYEKGIGHPIPSFDGYDEKYFIERIFWPESEMDLNNLQKSVKTQLTIHDLFEQFTENPQKNFILMSGIAGMGQSTMMTHLSHKIKEKSPDHWIVKIEVRRLKDCATFYTKTDAIDFISEKILKIHTTFEKELLKYLFENKKVVLLLDGFNEISPNYEKTVHNLIKILINNVSQLWVTTRPHLKENFGKNQQDRVVFYKLEPFSQDDQITFLTKFWMSQVGLQNEERVKIYAKTLLENLRKLSTDTEFTSIPLQTRILAEAFENEVKTFHCDSIKNKPVFVDQFDILDFYAKYCKVKFDLMSQKSEVIQDETHEIINKYGINKVYSNLALLMTFPEQEDFLTINKQDLLSLQINRFGVAEIIDGKEIHFFHQTFAEYYVAKYLSVALITNGPKEACNYFITKILSDDNCQTIRYFIDCFLKKNSIPNNYFEQYGEQIDKLFKAKTNKEDKITILHLAAREGCSNIIDFISKSLEDRYKETFKSILEEKFENQYQLAWHDAASEGHVEILEVLWKWAKYFNVDLKNMLLGQGKSNNTAWIQASEKNNFIALEKLWEWAEELDSNLELKIKLLQSKDFSSKKNAFHFAAENGNIQALETLRDWAVETDIDFDNDLLLSKDKNGQTVIHLAAGKDHAEVLKLLRDWATETECDFKNDLLIPTDKNGQTAFHLAAERGQAEVLKLLLNWATESECDFKKDLLLFKDNKGNTPIHLAVLEGHVEVLKILQEWATETEWNDLLLSKDDYDQTVFHLAAVAGHVIVLEMLEKWATELKVDFKKKNLLSKNYNGQTAFHLAASKGHFDVLKKLWNWPTEPDSDLKEIFLLSKDNIEQTVFHLAAWGGHDKIFEQLLEWAANTKLNIKDDLLLSKNDNEQTAFHLAAWRGRSKIIEMLLKWANTDLKKKLLLSKDSNRKTAFDLAQWRGHDEVKKLLEGCEFKT